jgi:hypothetical protein
MASPRLPSKLAKIWRKSRSQFQIAGIVNHAKTRAFAGLPGNGPKIYRTDVKWDTNKQDWRASCKILRSSGIIFV